ncbi:MAG TPA: serine hydrolase [Dehalococcoidia bacterium]|nr:serine hydrolase [Dehalococcoidia bacterium]
MRVHWWLLALVALGATACAGGADLLFAPLQEGPQEASPTPGGEEAPVPAERLQELSQQAQGLLADYPGQVAFVALDAASGQGVAINWDEPFIAASVIKLFTMMAVLRDVEDGLYALDDVWQDLELLMSYSDNDANARLTNLVGLSRINELMHSLGLTDSSYNLWPGVAETYGDATENYVTAHDLARALLALYRGDVFREQRMRDVALSLMTPLLEADQLILVRYLPEGVRVAHKTGVIPPDDRYPSVLHDVGIVFPPQGDPYVVVFLSQGSADHGAAYDLGAELSLLAYQAFATP